MHQPAVPPSPATNAQSCPHLLFHGGRGSRVPSRLRQGKALTTVSTARRREKGWTLDPVPKHPSLPTGPHKFNLTVDVSQLPPRYPNTWLRVRWLWKSWGGGRDMGRPARLRLVPRPPWGSAHPLLPSD